MKFKQIKTIDEVHNIIKTDTMTPAPLDDKNIMTDWIEEDLFDNNCGYYDCKWNGFVGCVPTLINIWANIMEIHPIISWSPSDNINCMTDAVIIRKLNELLNYDNDSRPADSEPIAVCETNKEKGLYTIRFYFGKYIGK